MKSALRPCVAGGDAAVETIARELAFTRLCAVFWGESREVREANALEQFLPALFQPILLGDRFAGRVSYPDVGMSVEPGGLGYYCLASHLERKRTDDNAAYVDEILDFWSGRTTSERCRQALSPLARKHLPSDNYLDDYGIAFPLYRIGGLMLDHGKLLARGLPGMSDAARNHPDSDWSFVVGKAYGVLIEIVKRYASEATDPELAACLTRLAVGPPKTLRDGIQLIWLVSLAAGVCNYGRLDIALGPLLFGDLESGRLTHAEAQDLITAFWRHIPTYPNKWNNRVIVGGKGAKQVPGAETFARLAITASEVVRQDQPQLSLRFSPSEDEPLLENGLHSLAEGSTYPILYNDDVYIPAIRQAFDTTGGDETEYLPLGCGEMMIDHRSVSVPNGVINLTACLLAALDDAPPGCSVDALWSAYAALVDAHMAALAEHQLSLYRITGEDLGFPLASSLIDDCESRGKWLLDGGVRYVSASVETYGNTNVADAFCALETTGAALDEVRAALREDWLGHELLRSNVLKAPKYGNDEDRADAWAVRVHGQVCHSSLDAGQALGWSRHHIVIVNNSMNVQFGLNTGATPDGRKTGAPFANANNPNSGSDRAGVTAMMNSLVKLDPAIHGGAVQNMKFSPELARGRPEQFRTLLETYFAMGGAQAMITVVNRADLEAAMKDPEAWGHLMVRVGGFSARFVELPLPLQLEILERTCHC